MKISLTQGEIEEAVSDFIIKQGISLKGREITIDFTAGRSPNGLTAEIDIDDINALPDLGLEDEDAQDASSKKAKPNHLKAVATDPVNSAEEKQSVKEEPVQAGSDDEDEVESSTSLFSS